MHIEAKENLAGWNESGPDLLIACLPMPQLDDDIETMDFCKEGWGKHVEIFW